MLVSQALDRHSMDLFSSRQTKPESGRAIHPWLKSAGRIFPVSVNLEHTTPMISEVA
jgi:hypothetical protein